MKSLLVTLILTLAIAGCGGSTQHNAQLNRIPVDGDPTPLPTPVVVVPTNQYFNSGMIGKVWQLQTADGSCTTTYHINSVPLSNYYPANSIVMNITKNGAGCYWAPGTDQASIDFVLTPNNDGSYRSMGSVLYFPTILPSWSPYHIYSQQYQAPAGALTPYMIVPPPSLIATSSIVIDTSYNRWDFNGQNFNSFISGNPIANVYWKTAFYMENGNAVSEQWEGLCGHEKWTFNSTGLIEVNFPNDGDPSCVANPSSTNIYRIN